MPNPTVQSESVITSPRGTFRIEREEKRNAGKGEFATTTFWITLAADPSQRVQLNEPVSDSDAWHFFISPDEQWICATVHEHSQLNSLKLYRCENGLQFKLVATEDEETEGPAWKFDKNDRVGPKDDVEADETGRVYNYFVAWSAASARLLVEKRVQEHDEKARKNVWFYHYFYFNLHRGKLEHSKYLRTLSRRFRDDDVLGNYAVPAFAEPLDALPPEKDLRDRYEAAKRRLNEAYPAFLEQAEDEKEKQERRGYQQLWLKAREAGCGRNMKPSVRDLEHALSIRRQINALEKRLAAILQGSIAKPKARRRPYEYDHHYGLTLSRTKKKGIGN